jgi:hypothetical protein
MVMLRRGRERLPRQRLKYYAAPSDGVERSSDQRLERRCADVGFMVWLVH